MTSSPHDTRGHSTSVPGASGRRDSFVGVAVAAGIVGAWASTLIICLSIGFESMPIAWLCPVIALQTFLHTGLFITAHDAMHGSVCPSHEGLNDAIGEVAVRLYALFSYESLRREHHRHHAHPVTDEDPDAADAGRAGFVTWYIDFLLTYVGGWQLLGMAVVYNVLMHGIGVSAGTLNVFWVLPSLLSTVQLFYFGTYLPHRRRGEAFRDEHHARSNDFSPLISFLTCYHFGYHWEHHERPDLPWWRLPRYRREHHESTTHQPPNPSQG